VTISTRPPSPVSGARASVAVEALQVVNWLSRILRRGSGTVAGGRVGLAIDPGLLGTLARHKRIALVSGTNGKTTTTRMLVAALSDGGDEPVAFNDTGANMPAGHVAALVGSPSAGVAVLEVDEGYLGAVIDATSPRVVVLLNLSRDQLDRIAEVRMLVDRWRAALGALTVSSDGDGPPTVVVANADDPMVAWAAVAAPTVRWVGAGQVWHHDAVGCPACGGRIVFDQTGAWACDRCDFARPARHAWLEGSMLVLADGSRHPVAIGLPGQFNRANAAMAAMAAPFMLDTDRGAPPGVADLMDRVGSVHQVAGRFSSIDRHGHTVRLLLAKNPAGWTAIFDLLDEAGPRASPVVLSINARIADGFDPSWLWDVPFERLAGNPVVVTGDRRLDLAVRLHYAEVAHTVVDDPVAAVDRAVEMSRPADAGVPSIDFVGNYTAFADLRGRL